MNCGDNLESNADFHIQDEAKRLLKEVELMMKNVENSEFYAGMRLDLEQNEAIQKHFFRLLGSHSHVQVVIYGLGSIEYSFSSQFQLAVVLLLKRDFSNWIGNIEIYDPVMSPSDITVFKELGLEVLTVDENCKRKAQRPTLFYMPSPYYYLIGNLLGANWSSSCLN
ncbi:protein SENSITIVITY TO RED LIGHT REDUCED 1-like [Lycium ferocissimum]|uniref:protein SENSITIVITY TO RED LIGHT REDUCED 1-like n=1 Tax=Lycium ferocissimum TaxID=112874 RepID=UPI002815CEF0|nr:protein SENSITIVITY TO RED LIGHT REDUCED 1-like [Lycium ferocissimum]